MAQRLVAAVPGPLCEVAGCNSFNELGDIVKPPSKAKKALYRECNDDSAKELKLYLIEYHRFAAMRFAGERSL